MSTHEEAIVRIAILRAKGSCYSASFVPIEQTLLCLGGKEQRKRGMNRIHRGQSNPPPQFFKQNFREDSVEPNPEPVGTLQQRRIPDI